MRQLLLTKLLLQALADVRPHALKADSVLATINFSADPPCTQSEFDQLVVKLERERLLTVVRNPVALLLTRLAITDSGVAALANLQ